MYIRSIGNISPQHSLDKDIFFQKKVNTDKNYFRSIEPDYDSFVDSKMIRRMSRIVKMGIASASTCLRAANVSEPAAILTATAYGCLEDSASFLRRMIEFEEKTLSPTAFIQSTHNTVGAQIALLLKCHHYNNTIVHRSFSFENALVETKMLLAEGIGPVLVGAVDEITDDRHTILSRFGLYRNQGKNLTRIAGEGSSFFLLDGRPGNSPMAVVDDVQSFIQLKEAVAFQKALSEFLERNEANTGSIEFVLSSGLPADDKSFFRSNYFPKPITAYPYTDLCGDYPTASGFALWLATILVSEQRAPGWMKGPIFPMNKILVHSGDGNGNHSFILISRV